MADATFYLRLSDPGMHDKELKDATLPEIDRVMRDSRDYTHADLYLTGKLTGSAHRELGGDEPWIFGRWPWWYGAKAPKKG